MATQAARSDVRSDLVRSRLALAAERRRDAISSHEQVSQEIRRLVRDAEELHISMAEVARILNIDRSSLYRTYVNVA